MAQKDTEKWLAEHLLLSGSSADYVILHSNHTLDIYSTTRSYSTSGTNFTFITPLEYLYYQSDFTLVKSVDFLYTGSSQYSCTLPLTFWVTTSQQEIQHNGNTVQADCASINTSPFKIVYILQTYDSSAPGASGSEDEFTLYYPDNGYVEEKFTSFQDASDRCAFIHHTKFAYYVDTPNYAFLEDLKTYLSCVASEVSGGGGGGGGGGQSDDCNACCICCECGG